MIGERLDFLPDYNYHKDPPASHGRRDFATACGFFFSPTNIILVDFASSHPLTFSRLLRGSPSIYIAKIKNIIQVY